MTNLKRNKPLMIDSHTAPSFIDSDYIYNEIDSPDDDENNENMMINATESLTRRRGFVELESDSNDQNNNNKQLAVEEVTTSSGRPTKIGVINKHDLYNSYINDTEIETINNAKNVAKIIPDLQMSRNNINNNITNNIKNKKMDTNHKPIVKRLKTSDIQIINNPPKNVIKIPNVHNFQIMNGTKNILPHVNQNTVLTNTNNMVDNIEKESNSNQQQQQLLDNNLFLINSVGNVIESNQGNNISDVTQQTGLMDSMNLIEQGSTNSPIVSMPASPNLNSNRNTMLINEQATSDNSNGPSNENNLMPASESLEAANTENTNLKRTISK